MLDLYLLAVFEEKQPSRQYILCLISLLLILIDIFYNWYTHHRLHSVVCYHWFPFNSRLYFMFWKGSVFPVLEYFVKGHPYKICPKAIIIILNIENHTALSFLSIYSWCLYQVEWIKFGDPKKALLLLVLGRKIEGKRIWITKYKLLHLIETSQSQEKRPENI